MAIEKFEDMYSWQKAKELTLVIYKTFNANKDYGFKDQIQRASVSIMNNIAEGFERKSNKEFKHFLFIAKGSCGEVRSMLQLAEDLQYVDLKMAESLLSMATETSKLLSGMIKKV